MKLTKKNIGQLFDCTGGDGSWCFRLLDIRGKDLLFYALDGKYWIMPNKDNDWRHPLTYDKLPKKELDMLWGRATRDKS